MTAALRDDLRLAVLNYADIRRLKAYRDLAELEALFQSIIDCARRLIETETVLERQEQEASLWLGRS